MCQSSDNVQITVIIHNKEPWMLSATGELDGEPIRLDAACIDPVSIAGALYDFGHVLDSMRLGFDERPVT
jgi:hypothetical protein